MYVYTYMYRASHNRNKVIRKATVTLYMYVGVAIISVFL